MNKKKLLYGMVIPLFAVIFVSAAILSFYGQINLSITAQQAVILYSDGIDVDCEDNICDEDLGTVYSPDTILSSVYILTNLDPEKSRDINLSTDNVNGVTTTYVKPIALDNKADWGTQQEAVGFNVDADLDELFANGGLEYAYTVLNGGTYNGAASAMAVIDLDDGRHVVLFPGWGSRTGTNTLTFSDTVASDTGGNGYVDFIVYDSNWIKVEGSPGSYPAWTILKTSLTTVDGNTEATRVRILTQGADTGQEDQIETMLVNGVDYVFIEGTNGDGFTISSLNPKSAFVISNDFNTSGNQDYIITTEAIPA